MTITPAYLLASLVLAITPGPGVLYVVTRSVTQGRIAGLMSVAGVASGNLGNALAASLGLATLFALSTLAFTAVKLCGALYLLYLGVRTLLARSNTPDPAAASVPQSPPKKIYLDGLMVALFNPKTALFFAAFVPQFLDAESATPAGTLTLSVVFVIVAAMTDCLYALLAGSARRLLSDSPTLVRSGRYVSGGTFIALGLFAAFSDRRHA